jgi:hypothetical protein
MILNQLQDEQGWFFAQIKMSLQFFMTNFGKIGVSGYYRLLSNSQHMFLGRTNRQFFKTSFKEGFYRAIVAQDEVSIVLILKCEVPANRIIVEKELKIRIKKLLYAIIQIGSIEELPEDEKTLLNSNFGFDLYQRILETYTKYKINK